MCVGDKVQKVFSKERIQHSKPRLPERQIKWLQK